MGSNTQGWTTASLNEVIEDYQAGFASGNKDVKDGLIHLRMNNISVDGTLNLDLVRKVPKSLAKNYHFLQKGDVLFCTTNSAKLVGKCAVFNYDGEYAFSNHLTRLKVNSNIIEHRLLHLLLLHLWQQGEYENKCKHWVNQSTLPKEELLSINIPLPPLNEQKRIVAKLEKLLSKVNACRDRLDKIPSLLKRFRQSVLSAACSGKLTEDWRKSHADVETASALYSRIKQHRLKSATSKRELNIIQKSYEAEPIQDESLPDSWLACNVGQIGNVSNGSTPSRKVAEFWSGSIPWVSSGEVQNNIIHSTRETITELGYEESSVRWLPSGTVLLAMIGEGRTRGQSAILKLNATINQNIAAISLEHGLMDSEYLWYWFRFQYLVTRQEGSGSGPQALNCQSVRELPFHLPPLEEQKEIVRRVEALFKKADAIEARYKKAKAYVDRLTQSILAKAFRGELVPQDPNDESASVLLERIKAEQDNSRPPKKNGSKKGRGGY